MSPTKLRNKRFFLIVLPGALARLYATEYGRPKEESAALSRVTQRFKRLKQLQLRW
jgi:hypothetical protein